MKFDKLVNQYLGVLKEEDMQNAQPAQPIDPNTLNDPNFKNLWAAVTAYETAANNKQDTTQILQAVKDAYTKLPQQVKQYGDQLLNTHPDKNVQNLAKQYKAPQTTNQNNQQDNQQKTQGQSNSGNPSTSAPAYKTGTPVG